MIKSKRQVIEEMLIEHVNQERKEAKLEEMGIRVPSFEYGCLFDWALDLIGFPADTTEELNSPDCFCRDYLLAPFSDIYTAADVNLAVSTYVDWLMAKRQEYLAGE